MGEVAKKFETGKFPAKIIEKSQTLCETHHGILCGGKVDEKATQLHAIASLKVLLDATKPQRGAATSSAANHHKPQTTLTMAPDGMQSGRSPVGSLPIGMSWF
uniref:Uncharacterized protein n=1 Tax=Anopheles dirus TaxID=7168 RepID=A0A182NTW0_9DIPT